MLLLLVEAMLLFSGSIVAVYVRLGVADAEDALINRNGFYKAALATVFCLASFYLFDLYDFVVMHDRRELVLRMLQALGLAWIALALLFYVVPQVMIGRGVSLISLPAALLLMVGWRLAIHWVLGHPELGERILIVGSGPFEQTIHDEASRLHVNAVFAGFLNQSEMARAYAAATRATAVSAKSSVLSPEAMSRRYRRWPTSSASSYE